MGILRQTSIIPEWLTKVAAVPAGVFALGGEGGLVSKMAYGAKTVMTAPFQIPAALSKVQEVAQDYTTMVANAFTEKYGPSVVQAAMDEVHGGIEYCNHALQNLQDQPAETLAAGASIAALMYGTGRAIRFWRQKGQGSWADRLERGIGRRFWKTK